MRLFLGKIFCCGGVRHRPPVATQNPDTLSRPSVLTTKRTSRVGRSFARQVGGEATPRAVTVTAAIADAPRESIRIPRVPSCPENGSVLALVFIRERRDSAGNSTGIGVIAVYKMNLQLDVPRRY